LKADLNSCKEHTARARAMKRTTLNASFKRLTICSIRTSLNLTLHMNGDNWTDKFDRQIVRRNGATKSTKSLTDELQLAGAKVAQLMCDLQHGRVDTYVKVIKRDAKKCQKRRPSAGQQSSLSCISRSKPWTQDKATQCRETDAGAERLCNCISVSFKVKQFHILTLFSHLNEQLPVPLIPAFQSDMIPHEAEIYESRFVQNQHQ